MSPIAAQCGFDWTLSAGDACRDLGPRLRMDAKWHVGVCPEQVNICSEDTTACAGEVGAIFFSFNFCFFSL